MPRKLYPTVLLPFVVVDAVLPENNIDDNLGVRAELDLKKALFVVKSKAKVNNENSD